MKPARILLVEDDADDVALMREAFAEAPGRTELDVAVDGRQALDRLRSGASFALILLDWRLPRLSGAEVLREVGRDAALRLLPVIVLTTSASQADARLAYELGASAFVTKPTGMAELIRFARALEEFWLGFVRLPISLTSDPLG